VTAVAVIHNPSDITKQIIIGGPEVGSGVSTLRNFGGGKN
jgi:hypothetical protein